MEPKWSQVGTKIVPNGRLLSKISKSLRSCSRCSGGLMTGSAPRGTVSLQADRLDPRGRSGGGKGSPFSSAGGWRIFLEGQNGAKTAPRRPKTRQDVPRCAKMRPRGPQDGPRRFQDAPKCPQEAPRRPRTRKIEPKWRQVGTKIVANGRLFLKISKSLRSCSRCSGGLIFEGSRFHFRT